MMKKNPKIAIAGFALEANSLSPVSTREDFEKSCWYEGEVITTLARQTSHLPAEVTGFYARMDEIAPWTAAPTIVIGAPPGGPVIEAVWREFMQKLEVGLREAMPVDGVYVANHGASSAEHLDDTEGDMMALIRAIVGPEVPVIATHDLHCNVSERTIDALDALISYRTNPHVDQRERAAEAADLMVEMLSGQKTTKAFIRMPITPPSVTLLTARGPYADLINMGTAMMQSALEGPIANVSVSAGFVFSDLPKCGMTISVTSRGDLSAARRCALKIARAAWADRGRYVPDMLEIAQALEKAKQTNLPLLFADVADNPGGGGRGNTTWLLSAFNEAKIPGVLLGVFIDPELAQQAHLAGEGGEFEAVFNATESQFSKRYSAKARVLKLTDGECVGRRGIYKGKIFSLGPSALIALVDTGTRVVVGTLRRQLCDPAMLEMHGIDISKVQVLIVKSRGHYRAGFDEFFPEAQIFDVDSPGLTTPNLKNVDFKRLPRPVFPIDHDATWTEPDWAKGLL
jgi:microcystin degradation protein MlrC